MKNIVNILSDN